MHRLATPIIKFAVVLAALAAVAAGSATAASLITGKQVKNGSLTGKDIRKRSLGVKQLSTQARAALKGNAGAPGAAGASGAPGAPGAKGDTGAKGDQGERGPSTAYVKRTTDFPSVTLAGTTIASLTVPNGSYTLQAATRLGNNGAQSGTPQCELGVRRGEFFEAVDSIEGLKVGASGSDTAGRSYALLGFAKVDNGSNSVELRCSADDGQDALTAAPSTLIATQVAELK